jgi:Ca2+-binding EF-hand superfamily protein
MVSFQKGFNLIDDDKDGFIEYWELKKAYEKAGLQPAIQVTNASSIHFTFFENSSLGSTLYRY